MSRARLIKRLKWYYPTEKLHTYVTFPLLLAYMLYQHPIKDIILLTYGLVVCIVILYQGQHYWKLKLHSLQRKEVNQPKNILFFQKSKKVNQLLILLMPLFLLLQLYLENWNVSYSKVLLWGVLANLFAIAEHINYYHIQLMIDNQYDWNWVLKNKRLKTASLAKDLLENKI